MTDRPNDFDDSTIRSNDRPMEAAPGERDPGFDDGLVHDHGWACRERGVPA